MHAVFTCRQRSRFYAGTRAADLNRLSLDIPNETKNIMKVSSGYIHVNQVNLFFFTVVGDIRF